MASHCSSFIDEGLEKISIDFVLKLWEHYSLEVEESWLDISMLIIRCFSLLMAPLE